MASYICDPEVYRFVPQGLATGITFVGVKQKRAIPYGTAPSEASRRSGRSSALPYPPIAGIRSLPLLGVVS